VIEGLVLKWSIGVGEIPTNKFSNIK